MASVQPIEGTVLAVGDAVRAQAQDTGIDNTNPIAWRGAVTTFVGAVATILVLFGLLPEASRETLVDAAGDLVVAALILIPIVQGVVQIVWTRAKAYSPRTAAASAVANAESTTGVPVLVTPP